MYKIKHREELLWQLSTKLQKYEDCSMACLKVSFFEYDEHICDILGFIAALDYIVNDIYRNEEANWENATRLEINTY